MDSRVRHRQMACSIVLAAALFFGGATLAAGFVDPTTLAAPDASPAGPVRTLGFVEILMQNTGAALLLFSGVITGGSTTVLSLLGVSAFVGATVDVATHHAGWAGVVGSTWTYVFIEFAGIVLAGAAGLHPLTAAVLSRRTDTGGPWSRYLKAIPGSLWLLAAGASLIVIGAVIESVVIANR